MSSATPTTAPAAVLLEAEEDTAAGPPAAGGSWRPAPTFMVRVGGLPFDTAQRLASPRTAAWADEVVDTEESLRRRAAALSDALEALVARHADDGATRRLLINLRRDVFNGRTPKGLDAVRPLLSPAEWAALRGWVDERRARDVLGSAGEGVASAELVTVRAELRAVAAITDLRKGIQLSSPSLDTYLDGYLRRDAGPSNKRERRIERSLLEYLYRTACKTSPFSTLTAVTAGGFAERGGRALTAVAEGWEKRSTTRLNTAVLARLSDLLTAHPNVRADLPVLAAGARATDRGRVRYLRRLRKHDGSTDGAVTLDAVHESLFFLPAGDVLGDVLELFGGADAVPFGDAVRLLCGRGGDRPADAVAAYLAQLLRLGLLVVPALRVDIHDPDPVTAYARGLRTLGSAPADAVACLVERMAVDAADFATADPPERRELLDGVRDAVAEAHRLLGREDLAVPRTLVYEDTTLPGLSVTADTREWERRVTPGLRRLARLMPAFDGNLVRRLVTKGYFTVRYGKGGTCDDFLAFAHEFGQDLWDNYQQRLMRHRRFDGTVFRPYDNWFKQAEITGVDAARAAVAEEVARRFHARPDGGGDLALDDDFVESVAARLPESVTGGLRPLSFFLQIADDGTSDPLVVVNRVYSGLTLLFSRFAHCFGPELTASLRATLAGITPPGAVFAELKGGYDATNLNLHPAVTPYELVCPGESSFRPDAERIPVEDLVVAHDPATDRLLLRSRRLGVEVIPVYLGFLLPMALPEIQQVLLNFSLTTFAQLDLWEGTGVPESGDGVLPRITLGNTVLQRASWRVPVDDLPPAVAGAGDAEAYLGWRRWQRAHRLPRHVFVGLEGEHKPSYVDFDSLLSVQLLDTAVRRSGGTAVFTEMLPAPEDLWLGDGRQRYVTELTVELDGTDGAGR